MANVRNSKKINGSGFKRDFIKGFKKGFKAVITPASKVLLQKNVLTALATGQPELIAPVVLGNTVNQILKSRALRNKIGNKNVINAMQTYNDAYGALQLNSNNSTDNLKEDVGLTGGSFATVKPIYRTGLKSPIGLKNPIVGGSFKPINGGSFRVIT